MKERIKKITRTILTANASPAEVALGCATGIFVAFLPIVPIQSALLFPLLFLIPRLNRTLAYGVSWVMNPFTIVPVYVLEFWTGRLIFPGKINTDVITKLVRAQEFGRLLHMGTDVLLALMTGGLIWAVLMSSTTYFAVFFLLKSRRKRSGHPDQ